MTTQTTANGLEDGNVRDQVGEAINSEFAIRVSNLSKCYQIYDTPRDRLKQFVLPRVRRIAGKAHKQYFREFWALKDVSFEIKKGETVGIIGRNGSGKSTLLQMICGTLTPTGGSIDVSGRVAALLELGSGFNPEFTGRENVYMNAAVLGLTSDEIDAQFDNIVAFADIGEFIEQPVKTYSSGMFVRLAFAVVVHVQPDILVVDEALSVGDIAFQNRCMERIRQLKQAGASILFVSHDLSTVQILCDQVIWIKHGFIQQYGDAGEVCQNYYAETIGKQMPNLAEIRMDIPQQVTQRARFSMLEICDRHMQRREVFNVGESMTVRFELEAESALEESIFTVSIYRGDGDWSVGQTSAEKQVIWPAVASGKKLSGQLLLSPICLTPADYKICFSAFSLDLQTCYAMTDVTIAFSIRSPYQTWGKFIHPCEWLRLN